jgi:hypothetical protein
MPTELRLWLPGCLPPSPNRLLGVHWSLVRKERVKARAALLSALSVVSTVPIMLPSMISSPAGAWIRNLDPLLTVPEHSSIYIEFRVNAVASRRRKSLRQGVRQKALFFGDLTL